MSQEDLAKAANVDVKTVRDFELGKRWPWSKTRSAIARALGVSALDLQGAGEPEAATVPREELDLSDPDEFERAALATDKPYPERIAAIRRHRELLAELGISEIPEALRRAVRRYAGVAEPGDAEQRRGA